MRSGLEHVRNWESLAQKAESRPATMAAYCGVTLRQLERFFARRFRTTPGHWTRELRCRLARDYIRLGWSDKAVVAELKFANSAHLCHEFQRFYHAPPQSFAPRRLE